MGRLVAVAAFLLLAICTVARADDASTLRAWRSRGADACFLNDRPAIKRAWEHLDARGQQFLLYVCDRNGIELTLPLRKQSPPARPLTKEQAEKALQDAQDEYRGAPPRSPGAEPPDAGEIVGTPHPLRVNAVAPDGRWVVVEQAREDTDHNGVIKVFLERHQSPEGDHLQLYLVGHSGPGVPIDDYFGDGDDGHVLAVARDRHIEVIDTDRHRRTVLRYDETLPPRAIHTTHLDDDALRIAYWRRGARPTLAVRDLVSGREQIVWSGEGEPCLVEFADDWLHVYLRRGSDLAPDPHEMLQPDSTDAPTQFRPTVLFACNGTLKMPMPDPSIRLAHVVVNAPLGRSAQDRATRRARREARRVSFGA